MKHIHSGYLSVLLSVIILTACVDRKEKIQEANPPNIVFILTDDQAWNMLGRDGRYPFMKTPNLDALAGEGIVFDQAFVTTSLCSPSRASFLTGCYAHRHGVFINSQADPAITMVQEILQVAGYKTAFIGKWHMAGNAEPRKGFDYWLSFKGQGIYIDPELNENGDSIKATGYMTDILTEYAIKWMKGSREKPFCLFLWHKAIHAPFTPAPRHDSAFSGEQIKEYDNWYDSMEGKPEWMRRGWLYGVHNRVWNESAGKPVPGKIEPRPWDPANTRWMNYMRAMLAVDESTGQVRDCLEEMGILDNTMIIYSSDNGFFIGSHQRGDKRLMYEESIRIPLIIRYPGLTNDGGVISDVVLNVDIAPTLIDIAGADVPQSMQGRSLVPLINGDKDDWRNSFLYEYFQEEYAPGIVTMTGIRTAQYKYIRYPDTPDDIDELYDLIADPGEMTNLVADHNYATVLAKMKIRLDSLERETGYHAPEIKQ